MQLTIKHPFLCLPVVSHPKDTRVLKLFDGEKLLLCVYFPFGEAAADNGTYSYEYLSPLPVSEWMGRTLTLSAEFPAGFEDAVTQTDELPVSSEVHPAVHFQPTQAGSTIQMVLFTTMEPITYIISTIPSVSIGTI